jgi:hypothetical protein
VLLPFAKSLAGVDSHRMGRSFTLLIRSNCSTIARSALVLFLATPRSSNDKLPFFAFRPRFQRDEPEPSTVALRL